MHSPLHQADPLIKTARDAQQTPRGAAGIAPTSIRGLDNEVRRRCWLGQRRRREATNNQRHQNNSR